MTHLCIQLCLFVIWFSIYIKSRKIRRVPSLSHHKFSDARVGKLYFFTAHGHYLCLSPWVVGMPINYFKHCSTLALIFSIVTITVQPIIKIHFNRGILIFSVFCRRNFSRSIFFKFYFSYISILINISYKSWYRWKITRYISLNYF